MISLISLECKRALDVADKIAKGSKKQRVYLDQAAYLYSLVSHYDRPDANILEVGTYYGYTAAIMAQAAPRAKITTLNPVPWEYADDIVNLKQFKNIRCFCVRSWEYIDGYGGPELDFVFIDGDHKRIVRDLQFWNWLKLGGTIFFHDYSPKESTRPCPPVFRALNEVVDKIGRKFDILVVDKNKVGMAGWVRQTCDIGRLI